MTIQQMKDRMKEYRDFYGGDLITSSEIDKAKTKAELSEIIDKHECFMEEMLSDARTHLKDFKEELGLLYY